MGHKMAIVAGAVTAGLLITGIAFAAQDDSGSTSVSGVTSTSGQTSSNETTSTTATTSASIVNGSGTVVLTDGQRTKFVVENAGSVLLSRNGGTLTVVSTESNPGWAVEVEVTTGREVEGDFRNGNLRIKFNFELEDGVVKVKIESEGSTGASGTTNTTAAVITTATTNTTATINPTSTTNTTATTNPTSTTNTTGASSLPTGSVTYSLEGAGTVTVIFANGGMTIGSINPATGLIVDKSDQSSNEIEVELKFGEAEVELNLHIAGGQLVVQIIKS